MANKGEIKTFEINFSFDLNGKRGEYTTEKLLGTGVRGEVVPTHENPVNYLRKRLLGELERIAPRQEENPQ